MASAALAIVLAVYMPPQVPAVGQTARVYAAANWRRLTTPVGHVLVR